MVLMFLFCFSNQQRVLEAAQRIEQLSSTLRTLRTSFHLFTQDVQQHMNTMTEQLEEAIRLRYTGTQRGKDPSAGIP